MATKVRRTYVLTFTECRSLGHEWRKGQPLGVQDAHERIRRPFKDTLSTVGIPSTCINCGTEKVRWIARSGESFTRYEHPEGYECHGEDVRPAKEWRQDYVATIFGDMERTHREALTIKSVPTIQRKKRTA